jgi:hypothetical protein
MATNPTLTEAADWLIRDCVPFWLKAADLKEQTAAFSALAPITDFSQMPAIEDLLFRTAGVTTLAALKAPLERPKLEEERTTAHTVVYELYQWLSERDGILGIDSPEAVSGVLWRVISLPPAESRLRSMCSDLRQAGLAHLERVEAL